MSLESALEGIRSELEQKLGIEVVDGYVEGPLEQELGCVWPEATEEDEDNVSIELLELRARVYKAIAPEYTPAAPADNSELLVAREAIVEALKPKQTTSFGVWYFRIRGFTFEVRERWVEARITAWQDNPYDPDTPA